MLHFRPITALILAAGLLGACSEKKTEHQALTSPGSAESVPAADSAATVERAPAVDSTNLSPAFVAGLRDMAGGSQYKVRGRWLVLSREDSVAFPTELPAGQPVTYSGVRGWESFSLTVTRLNYTSLRFRAEATGPIGEPTQIEAVADLSPGFYLTDELPGAAASTPEFKASEFVAETREGRFSILIGEGRDADKASLSAFDATGQPREKWRNLPTLRRVVL
ncbi:hypothetical protein LJY25_08805 [Hymenobacter sp. BT175]|uniref:hypothetical protein n=1 Tax=Hymenobacter translucens TaxID=2886507 RepID=UPI001D0EFEEE|nr:hypothetical protein [Hymenobacter translucens]MCC2546540.1 hypothetical protein [Hymenobacter translucens]